MMSLARKLAPDRSSAPSAEQILDALTSLDTLRAACQSEGVSDATRLALFRRGTDVDRATLLERADCPLELLVEALRWPHREIRYWAASDIRTPESALVAAVTDRSKLVREAVASNPVTPPSARASMIDDPESEVAHAAVRGALPAETVERLSLLRYERLWNTVATRSDLRHHQAVKLSERGHPWTRRQLAAHSGFVDVLADLAKSADAFLADALLDNPHLDDDVLDILCRHPDARVRRVLARWLQLPPRFAERLAVDDDVRVRRWVATVTTDPDLLRHLRSDRDASVRVAVGANWATAGADLVQLASDRSSLVRSSVRRRSNWPYELVLALLVQRDVAGRRRARSMLRNVPGSTPPQVASVPWSRSQPADQIIGWDHDLWERSRTAVTPRPPIDELDVGAQAFTWVDEAELDEIAARLAESPVHPWIALAALDRSQGHLGVELTAAVHPDPSVRRRVARGRCREARQVLWTDPVASVRNAALAHSTCTDGELAELVGHPNHCVRRSVLDTFDLPIALLDRLADDPTPSIRQRAAAEAAERRRRYGRRRQAG